jgi:hypothetical protein
VQRAHNKFEVRYLRCVSQITKLNSRRLKSKQNYIYQMMVTPNNYMFRPLAGYHKVVHSMKRVEGCTIYIVHVQPDDGLLEAEARSC